jgi:hypothetical protein
MANLPISAARAKIATYLGAVTQLKQLSNSRVSALTSFPACRYFQTGLAQQLISNAPRYLRTTQFTIEIIQPLTNTAANRVTQEQALEDALEATLDKLGVQWVLDNTVNATRVTGGTVVEVETASGPAAVATILFELDTFVEANP